jgi:hypothetical protein
MAMVSHQAPPLTEVEVDIVIDLADGSGSEGVDEDDGPADKEGHHTGDGRRETTTRTLDTSPPTDDDYDGSGNEEDGSMDLFDVRSGMKAKSTGCSRSRAGSSNGSGAKKSNSAEKRKKKKQQQSPKFDSNDKMITRVVTNSNGEYECMRSPRRSLKAGVGDAVEIAAGVTSLEPLQQSSGPSSSAGGGGGSSGRRRGTSQRCGNKGNQPDTAAASSPPNNNTPTTPKRGPIIKIDHSSHHSGGDLKFAFTYNDDDSSLGSSVCSGLRNSLHSSHLFDFDDLDEEDNSDMDSFGADTLDSDIEEVLHWRLDPKVSMSDWTMVIESVPEGEITKYHIHRSAVVSGPKRGDFFVSLFENLGNAKKSTDNNGDDNGDESFGYNHHEELQKPIKVHEDAAMFIPEMLDFLYSPDDELDIASDSATSLRHLSQFFGIRSLAKRVVSYMYDDICLDNVATYLDCANAFDDIATAKICADRCAQRVDEISSNSPLLGEMDPSFLLDIVSSKKLDRRKHSGHMSKLVAVFCILKRDVVNGSVFEELTSVEYLPIIDEESALPLLMLESKLVEESSDETTKALTLLQKRCIKAILPLVRGMSEVKEADRRARTKALSKIPKKVLVEILSRSIS